MPITKWKDVFLFRAYALAASGLTETKIAGVLGVSVSTLMVWERKKKLFRMALKEGRRKNKGDDGVVFSFNDYVYKRLSKPMKRVWERINALDKANVGVEKIERILAEGGKTMRQHLFFYAWTVSKFSISTALRKVNISRSTFEKWKERDSDFADLVDEINWHKKNFFEDHLAKLIAGGDSSATIFANRTVNRDRGYNEKTELDIKGDIAVNTLDIDSLDLPIDVRKIILEAMRKKEGR